MVAMVSRSPGFALTLNSKTSPGQMSPGLRAPIRLRPVEQMDRLGGGLQYYLAALLREISLSLRR